jgi:hypothetical protein
MYCRTLLAVAIAAALTILVTPSFADDAADIRAIREEMKALDERLKSAESALPAKSAPADAGPSGILGSNAFNPAMSLILGGQLNHLERDPATYNIGGFIPSGGEIGPGGRSFNLGESELTVSANIDPYFSGKFVMAAAPEGGAEVEEGYVQNSGAIPGATLRFGRFLSGIGYLNEIHAHAWDFADAPLVHQAFFGGALKEDGVQVRWLAPTPVFLEFGIETGRGANFPGTDRNKNGLNGGMLFAHVGDDVGAGGSYRVGASYRQTRALDRRYQDINSLDQPVINAFDGENTIWAVDLVWKWSPDGNPVERNFKFQAEVFRREEAGRLTYNVDGASTPGTGTDRYESKQSGWYTQAVYQFIPRWRAGMRYEALSSGTVENSLVSNGVNGLTASDFPLLAANKPKRTTLMMDFSASEFSRLRLQFARDQARFHLTDKQIVLQYVMSLGAHGAHKF